MVGTVTFCMAKIKTEKQYKAAFGQMRTYTEGGQEDEPKAEY